MSLQYSDCLRRSQLVFSILLVVCVHDDDDNDDDNGDNQVKRKEPQELEEEDLKRPRPSTPPDGDSEGLFVLMHV